MSQSQFAGTFLVTVAGSRLPADVEGLLTGAWAESNLHLPDAFELRFRDPDRLVIGKAGIAVGAQVTIAVQTTEAAAALPLFDGEATGLEVELDGEGTFTVVRGYDLAHRLRGGSTAAVYVNMTYDQIVARIAQRSGLPIGRLASTRTVHPHVAQGNLDDWTFLHRLADEVGFLVRMRSGKLEFAPPQNAATGPAPRSAPGNDPYVLEPGEDLLALRAVVSAAEQVAKVTVRAWNQTEKKPVTATTATTRSSATLSTQATAQLAAAASRTPRLSTSVPYSTQAEVDAAAAALADEIGGAGAELDGMVRGDPQLCAGHPIALANLGEPFDGRYILTRAHHAFTPDEGYTTAIAVTGAADRSLLGLATGGAGGTGGTGGAGRLPGLAVAVVTDVRDPRALGRVKLRLPWLDDAFTTDWAPTMQLGAGGTRGTLLLPEVDDQVLVGFEQGDLRRPYVLGGLHSVKEKPPTGTGPVDSGSGRVIRRALVTRTGHTLEFLESDAPAPGVSVTTGDGKLAVNLDAKTTKITVHSDGTVAIEGTSGVRVTAPNGEIALSGQKITLDAQSTVDVKGRGGVTVSTDGSLGLSGTTASVQGKSTAELKGGAMTTVSGALVKIN